MQRKLSTTIGQKWWPFSQRPPCNIITYFQIQLFISFFYFYFFTFILVFGKHRKVVAELFWLLLHKIEMDKNDQQFFYTLPKTMKCEKRKKANKLKKIWILNTCKIHCAMLLFKKAAVVVPPLKLLGLMWSESCCRQSSHTLIASTSSSKSFLFSS